MSVKPATGCPTNRAARPGRGSSERPDEETPDAALPLSSGELSPAEVEREGVGSLAPGAEASRDGEHATDRLPVVRSISQTLLCFMILCCPRQLTCPLSAFDTSRRTPRARRALRRPPDRPSCQERVGARCACPSSYESCFPWPIR